MSDKKEDMATAQAAYDHLCQQYQGLWGEIDTTQKRLGGISQEYLTAATPEAKTNLLTEHNQLTARLNMLPLQIGELMRQRTLAHLKLLVAQQAFYQDEWEELDRELSELVSQQNAYRATIETLTAQRRRGEVTQQQLQENTAPIHEKMHAVENAAKPLRIRAGKANINRQKPAIQAESSYNVKLEQTHLWERYARTQAAQAHTTAQARISN